MNACPDCKTWDLAPDDVFCSWCRRRLINIQAVLAQSRFSVAELPPPVDLVLSNRSTSTAIRVDAVEASVPWIRIDAGSRRPPFPLPPNDSAALTVRVETLSLTEDYHSGVIVVRTNLGDENLPVEVLPTPQVSISAYSGTTHRDSCRFEIQLDNRDLERNMVRIGAQQGIVAIEKIATDQPEWVKVRLPADCKLPLDLDSRKSAYVDVFIDVDESALTQKSVRLPAEYKANLVVDCAEFTHVEPLSFECWLPPALWIWEEAEYAIDAWAGQTGELSLTLQNSLPGNPQTGKGNAPLQVTRVDILLPGGEPCRWLQPSEDLADMIVIPGGERRQLRFHFATDAAGKGDAERLGIGRYPVVLVLTTNLPEVTRKLRFEVRVQAIKDFDGILAIDFGTSNTCCAIFGGPEQQYNPVPVDRLIHNPNPTTTPTLTQYLDLAPDGLASIKIGAEIDALSLSVKVIRSTARSPKRHLGSGEPFEICFYNSPDVVVYYAAKQVVSDYLREVRRAAERFRRGVRFRNIVVTHPSRFKLDQMMDLEEAVRLAFGADCEITLLPEPVAAALGFVIDPEALQKERYTVGVFDFGGGTTDLSLLAVENRRFPGYVEVHPHQVNSTGRWFGGENLTQFVYEQGLAGCRRIAAADHPDEELLVESAKETDGNRRQIAIQNHGRLLQWAEQTKLLLIQYGDDHALHFPPTKPDLFPDLKLSLWTRSGPEGRSFAHSQIVPKRADLDAYLRPHLENLAASLAGLVSASQIGALDYIRLSGKPSAIPLVSDVLAERFPKAQIRPAPEPKECVVEGACIPDRFRAAASVVLILDESGFVRTTSRIGIEDAGRRSFVELIGLGLAISEQGITGHLDSFPLRSGVKVRLLDNASVANDSIPGNPDITTIGTFVIDPAHNTLAKNEVLPARLELRLSRDFKPGLVAHVPGRESIPFVRSDAQAAQGGI